MIHRVISAALRKRLAMLKAIERAFAMKRLSSQRKGGRHLARPVFFDPSGRRRRWTRRLTFFGLIALVIGAIAFATTVVHIPAPSPLPLGFERRSALPMRTQVSRLSHSFSRMFSAPPKQRANSKGQSITVAFYSNWSDASAPSLLRHINQIDWVAPTSLNIDLAGKLHVSEDRPLRRILLSALHRPLVVPVLQNVDDDGFSRPAAEALFASKAKRKALIAQLIDYLKKSGDAGIIFDFEDLSPSDIPAYRAMIAEVEKALDKTGQVVAVTLPMEGDGWSPSQFAAVADKIILMAYDEHWASGQPGPIASNNWFATKVRKAIGNMPADKVIIALGSYAYDWHPDASGKTGAESLTVEEAWLSAHDSAATPTYDKASGNTGFSFLENGQRHDVWMIDAAASWNQMRILSQLGVGNIALWRLGTEDPASGRRCKVGAMGTSRTLFPT
jgi:spore germination protein YaaH